MTKGKINIPAFIIMGIISIGLGIAVLGTHGMLEAVVWAFVVFYVLSVIAVICAHLTGKLE